MEVASTKATLVESRDVSGSVTATIPRAEFEAALASEERAELFLEVSRPEEGLKRDVSVAWSRDDLERLLADTEGTAITLTFDRSELEEAADPEVEAHGLRDKALVLTVAAAAAAGGASSAAAAIHDEAGSTARGITPSYLAVHDEASLAQRVIDPAAFVSSHDEATLAARGIGSAAAATHDEATLASRGIEPGTVPTAHDEATLASRGIDPGTLPTTHDEATLIARGITPVAPAEDGGVTIDTPTIDASTVAAVGGGLAGLGLLITAAGFAVRRQRGVSPT